MDGKIYLINETWEIESELSEWAFKTIFTDTVDFEDEEVQEIRRNIKKWVSVIVQFTKDWDLVVRPIVDWNLPTLPN